MATQSLHLWKRTVLSPTMRVFDASAREYCTVRDTRTNTPLQSLNLMNDVTYVEAARLLAQRMLREGGATPRASPGHFRGGVPAAERNELQVLLRYLNWQMDYFKKPREATRLLSIGEKRNEAKLDAVELAAYSATASLILNLDEVITKQESADFQINASNSTGELKSMGAYMNPLEEQKLMMTRRHFFGRLSLGGGAAALASLLGESGYAQSGDAKAGLPDLPHFAPKAKRVIYLYQAGGPLAARPLRS